MNGRLPKVSLVKHASIVYVKTLRKACLAALRRQDLRRIDLAELEIDASSVIGSAMHHSHCDATV